MGWLQDKAWEWAWSAAATMAGNFIANLSFTSVILLALVVYLMVGPLKKAAGYASRVMLIGCLIVFVGWWWKAKNAPPPPPKTSWFASLSWPWAKLNWSLLDWEMPEWPEWGGGATVGGFKPEPLVWDPEGKVTFAEDMGTLAGAAGKAIGTGVKNAADAIGKAFEETPEDTPEIKKHLHEDALRVEREVQAEVEQLRKARKGPVAKPEPSLLGGLFGQSEPVIDPNNAMCGYCGAAFFTRVRSGDNMRCPRCRQVIGARKAKALYAQRRH